MKRLRHWLFNFAAAVSLLFFLLIMILWVRSFWAADFLSFAQTGPRIAVWSHRGRMVMDWMNYEKDPVRLGFGRWHWSRLDPKVPIPPIDTDFPTRAKWWWLGFKYVPTHVIIAAEATMAGFNRRNASGQSPLISWVLLAIPDWALAGIFAIIPAMWYARHRRSRYRSEHHMCAVCGYDLRATPDRCPECGAPVAAVSS